MVRQARHHDAWPLQDQPTAPWATVQTDRAPWYTALIELLVVHGADRVVTTSAVDRLADLFTTTAGCGPDDVAVAGFDDVIESRFRFPG